MFVSFVFAFAWVGHGTSKKCIYSVFKEGVFIDTNSEKTQQTTESKLTV